MTAPSTELRRFLFACAIGALSGLWYGALRPLRRAHPYAADLLFSAALIYAWLQLSFALCDGDLRLGYTAGLFLGCILEEATLGFLLRPVFAAIWRWLFRIFSIFPLLMKNFFKICRIFANFLFATGKK